MSKEKSDEYWQGYIQKQNESMQICEICKYRKDFREMENKLADTESDLTSVYLKRSIWRKRKMAKRS